MHLAEEDLQPSSNSKRWTKRLSLCFVALTIGTLIIWVGMQLSKPASPRHKQVSKIALLPDKPPPPPPPKEEPPPPKEVNKLTPTLEPKQAEQAQPKAAEPLKMEGVAGDGPSPFAAGQVRNEYQSGSPFGDNQGGNGVNSDRAREKFFAVSARQQLRDEIERHLKTDEAQVTASFAVWFSEDGSIARFEMIPTGKASLDESMQQALNDTRHSPLRLAPPPGLVQPLRFKLTLKPAG